MSQRRIVWTTVITLFVLLGSYVGGFVWFLHSDDWSEARKVLLTQTQSTVGAVREVEPSIIGFSYKFSGEYSRFHLNVELIGTEGEKRYSADFERTDGYLRMLSLRAAN